MSQAGRVVDLDVDIDNPHEIEWQWPPIQADRDLVVVPVHRARNSIRQARRHQRQDGDRRDEAVEAEVMKFKRIHVKGLEEVELDRVLEHDAEARLRGHCGLPLFRDARYYNRPDETDKTIKDGWIHTVTSPGRRRRLLYIVDRRKTCAQRRHAVNWHDRTFSPSKLNRGRSLERNRRELHTCSMMTLDSHDAAHLRTRVRAVPYRWYDDS